MKNAKPLIILCGVLAALIIGLFAVRAIISRSEQKSEQQAQDSIIYVGNIENAASVTFNDSDGQSLTFVLQDEQWLYQQDTDFPVKQTYLTRIADLINGCTATRVFENADLSEYGLDTPANTITAVDADGQSLTLNISEKKGDVCYASDSDGKVYVVSTNFVTYTSYALLDFAQTDTFAQADEDELSSVEISRGETSLTLTPKSGLYTDDISWYVTAGGEETRTDSITLDGDSSATAIVKNALNVLPSYRSSGVADYKPDDEQRTLYGLDQPVNVTFAYTDSDTGEQSEFTILIGGQNESGLWYFTVPDSDLVYTLSDSFASPMITALETLGQ
jgi:hypothetical protein